MIAPLYRAFDAMISRWDETAARADDQNKQDVAFAVGASLAFPHLSTGADHLALAVAVGHAMQAPDNYYQPSTAVTAAEAASYGEWLSFRSRITTEEPENNTAYARVREAGSRTDAVLLLPHWNAPEGSMQPFARLLNAAGFTTAIVRLPYHHQRAAQGSIIADYFVSANLGRTIRSVRQAVFDVRGVADWLEARGHRKFYIAGASLGSCIAGLVSAFDPRFQAGILILTAGCFAKVVWTGRATRAISAELRRWLTLDELALVWEIIGLEAFVRFFSRAGLKLLILSASQDDVIRPELTRDFLGRLRDANIPFEERTFRCGHYTLGMLPFNVLAAFRIREFLRQMAAR
jgi:hypothetical protein